MSLFKTCQICFIWTTFGILIDSLVAVTYELINYCKMLVDDLVNDLLLYTILVSSSNCKLRQKDL